MQIRVIPIRDKKQYNRQINHIMQSWEWGEFRQKLGRILRFGLYEGPTLLTSFQITLHKIPLTSYFVGYLPKGPFPDTKLADALTEIGKKYRCAFIKVEPNISTGTDILQSKNIDERFKKSPKPYFTKYNYVLDLTQSNEAILKQMHPKFRYNIKVAQKRGVVVKERTDEQGLEDYLQLYFDTTRRQGYQGHNRHYHQLVWQILKEKGMARLLIAYYTDPQTKQSLPLTAWMLFNFKDGLYYSYGGSSNQHRNVMASNLVAWEAILLGKKLGLKQFDLWGAAGPNASANDPFYGFTRFKSQIGAPLQEYLGSYDLILNPFIYYPFTIVDKFTSFKVFLLKLLGR